MKNKEQNLKELKQKVEDLERIIEYAADDLGVSVSYLKKIGLEWAKDDPMTNTDFENRNT